MSGQPDFTDKNGLDRTVKKAFEELELERLVYRSHRVGTFVSEMINGAKNPTELGILVFDVAIGTGPFYGNIIRGMSDASKRFNYNLNIFGVKDGTFQGTENQMVKELISERVYAGWFILSPLPYETVAFLKERDVPFVVVGNDYPDLDIVSVCSDFVKAGYQVTQRLFQEGFQEIGLLLKYMGENKDGVIRSSDLMFEGYRAAHLVHNRQVNTALIKAVDDSERSVERGITSLLQNFQSGDPFILCRGTISKTEVYEALRKHGLEPGRDIKVTNFADLVDSVERDCEEMGRCALETLHQVIGGAKDTINRKVRLNVKLKEVDFSSL